MAGQFEEKVVIVTGGSSGIGRAAAVAFAEEGARVTVSARRVEESEETVRLIKDADGEAIFVQADVSVEADCERTVTETLDAFGRLDCAFNNAGRVGGGGTVDCDVAVWNQVLAVNLTGVLMSMKYQIPQMIEQGGAIVNNASILGLSGRREAQPTLRANMGWSG